MAAPVYCMCRQASDPLRSGSVTGYQCSICGKQLQVTARGVGLIEHGGIPLCNTCGGRVLEMEKRLTVALTPEALERLREMERGK